jgi:hypothetical protein
MICGNKHTVCLEGSLTAITRRMEKILKMVIIMTMEMIALALAG